MLYAICDCDNCFVSCERVFRPDLEGKAVVVLSNNDGCVVARSSEAKKLGVKMGMPYYQMRQMYGESQVIAFSSNYELYADMTARVMSLLRKAAPSFFRYSIDEAFCVLPDMAMDEAKRWGEAQAAWIRKATGMPLSIGIARNKTLAKLAVSFAKKYPGYNKCCVIDGEEKREKALRLTNIGDVWGIGRRIERKMLDQRISSAWDFSVMPSEWVETRYNVAVLRTWRELNGMDCIPDEEMAARKSITVSRSFEHPVSDYRLLATHVANFAARCAEKLRRQESVAAIVGVYIVTNRFRKDVAQYGNTLDYRLSTPSSSSLDIVAGAQQALKLIYRSGYSYKKAGVILMGVSKNDIYQPDLFEFSPERNEKRRKLDCILDEINHSQGRDTVILGSQQYTHERGKGKASAFKDIIRHEYRSGSPTTNWDDLIELH